MRLSIAFLICLSSGCTSIFGFEEIGRIVPDGNGGSATGGNGGSTANGGSGGAGVGGVGGAGDAGAAPDWTASFIVYDFENGDAIGAEARGGPSLMPVGTPTFSAGVQGLTSVDVNLDNVLVSSDGTFNFTGSFTVGAWVNADNDFNATQSVLAKWDGTNIVGYQMVRDVNNRRLFCRFGDGVTAAAETLPVSTWLTNTWYHVTCRGHVGVSISAAQYERDAPSGLISPNAMAAQLAVAPSTLSLGKAVTEGFMGRVDEAFLTPVALADDAIRRIWACGIDGKLCTCSGQAANNGYVDCGRMAPTCLNLPDCESTQPALLP